MSWLGRIEKPTDKTGEDMRTNVLQKAQLVIEIMICFFLLMIFSSLFDRIAFFFDIDGQWVGISTYLCSALAIILYITRVNKKPIAYLGLMKPVFSDIPKGLLLGLCMFAVQQIPVIIMGFDYSLLAAEPDWGRIFLMSIYCFLCVGFAEELILRGFILQKTQDLCKSRNVAFIINCLLFYAIHWPPVRFVFGEFFNIVVNSLFLCVFLFRSKRKSLVPLMIAHGFYDIVVVYLLPVFLFYVRR